MRRKTIQNRDQNQQNEIEILTEIRDQIQKNSKPDSKKYRDQNQQTGMEIRHQNHKNQKTIREQNQ